jgi:hypothetical protein
MSVLVQRSPRRAPPSAPTPIDRGNLFGAATQFWVGSFGGDMPVRVDGGPQASTVSGVVNVMVPGGLATQVSATNASGNYVEWSQAGIDLSRPYSIALRLLRLTSSSSQYDRVFQNLGTGGTSYFGFLLGGSGDGNPNRLYFLSTDSSGVTVETSRAAMTAASTTQFETYVAVLDGANLILYQDGTPVSSVACSTFPDAALLNPIRFGRDGIGTDGAPVQIQFAHIMRGALTPSQVKEYTANPWQVFATPRRRIWVPASAGGAAYTLTAASGSFALTGIAAAPRAGRTLAAATRSYALTGNATGLRAARALGAAVGSFALTGTAAGLAKGSRLSAATGAFTLTGVSSAISFGRRLTAGAGTFILVGTATGLHAGKALLAGTGAFSLAGTAAGLVPARVLAASAGAFSVTGVAVALPRGRALAGGVGTFALTGNAAGVRAARALPAAAGVFTLTGNSANLSALGAFALNAGAGAFALAGPAARLVRTARLTAAPGSGAMTGTAAALRKGYGLLAAQGVVSLSGRDGLFSRTRALPTTSAGYTFTGYPAALTFSGAPAPTVYARIPGDAVPLQRLARAPSIQTTHRPASLSTGRRRN